jgi:hypothetical protein
VFYQQGALRDWSVAFGNLDAASLEKPREQKRVCEKRHHHSLNEDQDFEAAIKFRERRRQRVKKRFSNDRKYHSPHS